ncbi:hypothetical protein COW36_13290 [bacterium (Candidatus Blackallbacteria) CG17_big_fil_post_rev_8_21_14_2_50_48_46]|uniref:ATP-grasp domain-containing protein n=1 Tax=bacterium (Candidatus Blackallbacteria) CG17_big_fil_post_rev_8_21_14_2_50_48_46 TaxID=2014261 RepID=A0A2M7G473_9BACT|nr:MAG: hypothetical protein COW64_21905 [bacterium (Candidatus Blackallbacteria) CG18_big_fil_WC_8_21_14_2_50_49_26]PIW16304.1 MAG: hypothetical protein COW36_13290 [bacterium (Candidatus Blackallbacteria) CG17_big_fil_post_rev_8_21_14_2_50_48_46]PIW45318.1 MAG: hypothetical protein COW20_20525 [bacterium (Candidatus Blackallbacteria) CG13_big_fil_rev_8_21_14_2_50_49_14]
MPEKKPFSILLTSMGSLLGQNMLDTLEGRRDGLRIIGLNSVAENPRNFRADLTYLVPVLQDPAFFDHFMQIFEFESPDLILAGRDDDVLFLTRLKEARADLADKIPYGTSACVEIMQSKLKSFQFSQLYSLDFVPSFSLEPDFSWSALEKFVETEGFPLILKPLEGFGSHGVYIITEQTQLQVLKQAQEPLLLQPYLDPPADLSDFVSAYQWAMPLFFQIPDENQYAYQTVISPAGELGPEFAIRAQMVLGRVEKIERCLDNSLLSLGRKSAQVFRDQGWRGSFNLQAKQDKEGKWKVFEFSPRMTGSLSARRLLGFDEMGCLLQFFYPELEFQAESFQAQSQGLVMRSLTDGYIAYQDVERLRTEKKWRK